MAADNDRPILSEDKSLENDRNSISSASPPTQSSEKSSIERSEKLDPNIEHGIPVIDTTQDADEKVPVTETISHDPNVVDWESTEDPERPINWTRKQKWFNMGVIATITFLTPLASSMVAPGVPLILREFNESSETIGSFVVSIYVLGYAIGPLVIAPLSEVYGRIPVYHINNVLFTIWTLACALAPGIGSLLAFRLLAGIAGSCPITIGGGSISDTFAQSERGAAMALFALGPLMGPVIGPVVGGYLAEDEGWRWIFRVLTIAGGIVTVGGIFLLRETYEPVLLQRKTDKLIKETGNTQLKSKLDHGLPLRQYITRAIIRPSKMLIFSPIVLVFSTYMAIVYGYLYLIFTTLTLVFENEYGFSQGSVGLTYLGIGVGSLLGLAVFGTVSDRLIKRLAKGGEMKPEMRLPPLIPGSMLIPIGLFWYGWSAQKHIHWIMPIIGTCFVGMGLIATFMTIQTYMVDAFTKYAASAIAANTVLRSTVGAFLPLAGPPLYAALGLGWGNSLLGFIAVAMVPVTFMFYKYGERIRTHPRFQINF